MKFILIIGPMKSNKTSELIISYLKYTHNKKGKFYRHNMDTRFSNEYITTHNKKIKVDNVISVKNSSEMSYDDCDIIAIDELQFFDSDIYIFIYKALENGKIIIASGLTSDYRMKQWKTISECLPLATKIKLMKGICEICNFKSSTHTLRHDYKVYNKVIVESSDKYYSVCMGCYMKNKISI